MMVDKDNNIQRMVRSPFLYNPIFWAVTGFFLVYVIRFIYVTAFYPDIDTFAVGLQYNWITNSYGSVFTFAISCILSTMFFWTWGRNVFFTGLSEGREFHRYSNQSIIWLWCIAGACFWGLLIETDTRLLETFNDPFEFRMRVTKGGNFYLASLGLWCAWQAYYVQLQNKLTWVHGNTSKCVVLFCSAIIYTYVFGTRGYLITPILASLYLYDSKKKQSSLSVLLPLIALVIIGVGILGYVRDQKFPSDNAGGGGGMEMLNKFTSRFDALDFHATLVERIDEVQPRPAYGATYLAMLLQPIPRVMFEDKPYKFSAQATELLFPDYPRAFTPEYGIIAEAYFNGRGIGVVLSGVLFGAILVFLNRLYISRRMSGIFRLWYAPMVMFPMSFVMAGFGSDVFIAIGLHTLYFAVFMRAFPPKIIKE